MSLPTWTLAESWGKVSSAFRFFALWDLQPQYLGSVLVLGLGGTQFLWGPVPLARKHCVIRADFPHF